MCEVKLLQMAQRHVWSRTLSSPLDIPVHCWLVVALVRGSFGLLQGCLIVSHCTSLWTKVSAKLLHVKLLLHYNSNRGFVPVRVPSSYVLPEGRFKIVSLAVYANC